MCEMSVRFRLNNDDILNNPLIIPKRSISPVLLIFCGFAAYSIVNEVKSGRSPIIMTAVLLFFIGSMILRPFLYKRNIKKAYEKNYAFRTDIIVEFYNDHIVEKNDGGETNIKFESHFPLEAIQRATETQDSFVFNITGTEVLIIPKRALDEEQKQKLKNLIQNVFSNRF